MIKPQNLLPNLSPRQPLEDEYISETDGLIYCSKCHTPRQKKIEFLGKIMFPIIRCQCQQEQYEKEEAKRKHQEFLEHISRLKSSGLQDLALREFTFAHDNGINPEIEKAKNYVTHWEEIKSKAMGLLLWGDVGTGKSFFAGCVANALLDKGVPVLMTNFAKILNSLTGIYPQDRNELKALRHRKPTTKITSHLVMTGSSLDSITTKALLAPRRTSVRSCFGSLTTARPVKWTLLSQNPSAASAGTQRTA